MYKNSVAEKNNITASTLFYIIFAIGVSPLLLIFIVYMNNPDSLFLSAIASRVGNIPVWTSVNSLLLTKVMDVYCKTAPVLAVFWFLFSMRIIFLNKISDTKTLIRSCLCYPLLYFPFIYFLLCSDRELTTSGRILRLMSSNDYSLLLFYICVYFVALLMTCGLYMLPVIAYRLVKERR